MPDDDDIRPETVAAVAALMASYRAGATVAKETVDAYLAHLNDLPPDVAIAAVSRLVQTQKWLPAISEVRAEATQLVNPVPEPDEAWAEVREQMRYAGWNGKPTWSHPAIAQTVTAMGWRELCASDVPGVDRAQFLRLYAARRTRLTERQSLSADVREMAARLAGALTAEPRRELEAS